MNDRPFFQIIVATKDSLKLAKQVAEKLGLPFDDEAKENLAKNLHQTYCNELVALIGPQVESTSLIAGSNHEIRATVAVGTQRVESNGSL